MFQFIFGLIRGLWPIWLFLIFLFIYKKIVKPVSIKNFDLHNWNGILKVLQKRRNKWYDRFPVEIDATITEILQILNDFVPTINNKYSGFLVASDINKFMIQLYDLVEEFFDMSKKNSRKISVFLPKDWLIYLNGYIK